MRLQLSSPFFDFRWGVERETHRVQPSGRLSALEQPQALQPPAFTRDFAESQLELVTSPAPSIPHLVAELTRLTAQASRATAPELLWPFSMPPRLPEESEIRLAALDRRATLYREGLALRYGKARQMICGLHLNVSVGSRMLGWLSTASPLEEGEDSYSVRLARNLYRELPHLILLFGATPVREGSERIAVSHRNGPSGYGGAGFLPYLDLTSLEAYVAGIRRGLHTASTEFSAMGLVRDGRTVQLNGNVFQTEKEFYAPIRLREAALPGESGLQALARRGAGYLELRFFDVDPSDANGLSVETLRLVQLFSLDALMRPTAPRGNRVLRADLREAEEAAMVDPLAQRSSERFTSLTARLAELEAWARRLDQVERKGAYTHALEGALARAANPLLLPSAALARRFQGSGTNWTSFGIRTALRHRQGSSNVLEHAWV